MKMRGWELNQFEGTSSSISTNSFKCAISLIPKNMIFADFSKNCSRFGPYKRKNLLNFQNFELSNYKIEQNVLIDFNIFLFTSFGC